MSTMKTLNGYEIVDAKARESIETVRSEIPSLESYALKTDIPTVPTKVSELDNDKGYLTEHQSLEGLATEEYVTNAINNIDIPEVNLDDYVTEDELNNKGYLTQHQDLTDYAKKSDIPDVSDFITNIPSEYVTESELNAKGYLTTLPDHTHDQYLTDLPEHEHSQYLTEHQSLDNYYTKSETYNKTEVENAITTRLINTPIKDWQNISQEGNSNIGFYNGDSTNYIKIVGYFSYNSDSSYSFNVSAPGNFNYNMNKYFHVPSVMDPTGTEQHLCFYYDGSCISVKDHNHGDFNDFLITNLYYWG